jgi:hypothetical protein
MIYEFKRAKNGYIIEITGNPDDEKDILVSEEGADEHESFVDLLRLIVQDYGPTDGRYAPKRIHITCLPGDKFEGQLDSKMRESLIDFKERIEYALKSDAEAVLESVKGKKL